LKDNYKLNIMANKFLEAFDDEYKEMKSMKAKSNPNGMGMGKDCSGFISMLFKAKEDAHITHIEQRRDMYEEGWIQNQIDEVAQLIAHTIYRLKFVTTAPGQ